MEALNMRNTLVGICFTLGFAACGGVGDPMATAEDELRQNDILFCGGIAGFPCPDGMRCKLDGNYPDAGGTCIGPQGPRQWICPMIAIRCMEGTRPVEVGHCNWKCVPHHPQDQGQCRTDADCARWAYDNNIPHIMCVGSWTCERGQCAYQCSSTSLATIQ
jgi:hypothetical protein